MKCLLILLLVSNFNVLMSCKLVVIVIVGWIILIVLYVKLIDGNWGIK